MNEITYKVRLPDWMIPAWWKIAYKIPPQLGQKWGELINIAPDERFTKTVSRYVRGLIEEGKMPPDDIAPTIVNLANDLLNGQEMIIRTGDYIAIQNHLHQQK